MKRKLNLSFLSFRSYNKLKHAPPSFVGSTTTATSIDFGAIFFQFSSLSRRVFSIFYVLVKLTWEENGEFHQREKIVTNCLINSSKQRKTETATRKCQRQEKIKWRTKLCTRKKMETTNGKKSSGNNEDTEDNAWRDRTKLWTKNSTWKFVASEVVLGVTLFLSFQRQDFYVILKTYDKQMGFAYASELKYGLSECHWCVAEKLINSLRMATRAELKLRDRKRASYLKTWRNILSA